MKTTGPDLECLSGANAPARFMSEGKEQWLFIMLNDWTWWTWLATAVLLTVGLLGFPICYLAAF